MKKKMNNLISFIAEVFNLHHVFWDSILKLRFDLERIIWILLYAYLNLNLIV